MRAASCIDVVTWGDEAKRFLALSVWLFVLGAFGNRAFAQTGCSAVSIASPAGGSTVSGTVTLALTYSCSNWPGSMGFVRLEIVNPPWHIDSPPGVDSLTLDTTGMPNGPYQLYVTRRIRGLQTCLSSR